MTAETITNAVGTAVALFVIWGLWRAAQGTALFKVSIRQGKATADHGTVTKAFLDHLDRVLAAEAIQSGSITGRAAGKLVRLSFSRQIPESVRQQIRNWWAAHGWPPPRQQTRR